MSSSVISANGVAPGAADFCSITSKIFEVMLQKGDRDAQGPTHSSPFAEITDDDIDALFGE